MNNIIIRRLLALLSDCVIFLVIFYLGIPHRVASIYATLKNIEIFDVPPQIYTHTLTLLFLFYFVVFEIIFLSSIGKKIFKLKLVRPNFEFIPIRASL
ncbi:MAG: RDD family protein [Spirochaetaceae bacterium]